MGRFFLGAGFAVVIFTGSILPDPEDKVVFLDVGQGDAILFQDGTAQVLIDGGEGAAVLQGLAQEMPYTDRTLEVIIVTHPQQDHLEGLLHVVERYEVGMVIMPNVVYDSKLYALWQDMLEDRETPVRYARAGQKMTAEDMEFTLLWPVEDPAATAAIESDVNNASVSTRVDFKDLSFLLTGDLEKRAETLLLGQVEESLLDVDILKAGHHGSNTSTHAELLNATTPSAVVISVGKENRFGHPHPDVLERLSGRIVWRTDEIGSVRLLNKGDAWYAGQDGVYDVK